MGERLRPAFPVGKVTRGGHSGHYWSLVALDGDPLGQRGHKASWLAMQPAANPTWRRRQRRLRKKTQQFL